MMSTELTTLINRPIETDVEEQNDAYSSLGNRNWNDRFTVVWGSSNAYVNNVSEVGNFCFADKVDLGKETEITVLDRRFHAGYFNPDTKKYTEHCYATSDKDKTWMDFLRSCPSGFNLNKGADLFIYIPGIQKPAEWFMKSTLAKYVNDLWMKSTGARILKIKTEKTRNESSGNVYFQILITPTTKALAGSNIKDAEKIAVDIAAIEAAHKIFIEAKGLESVKTEDIER